MTLFINHVLVSGSCPTVDSPIKLHALQQVKIKVPNGGTLEMSRENLDVLKYAMKFLGFRKNEVFAGITPI